MPFIGVQPSRGLVGTAGIDADAITSAKIADDQIDSEHYAAGSIDTAHIAANQVDGTLTKDALIADYSDVTITASDLIMYGDATDSNNTKRDTVQGVLDLVSASFTASSLTALTASSTSTITGVPSGTKVIFVSFEGIDLSSGSGVSGVRIGDSGGIETSGYLSSGTYLDSGTTTADNTTLFIIDTSMGTAGDNRGSGVLTLMDSSTNLWAWSCTAKGRSANVVVAGGDKALSGALTQVQLLTTGGTFVTTGSWNILYM